jgi:two-component system chemotaxis response regulator CheB
LAGCLREDAYVAGPRTIGIVLSGTLDDRTAGLWAIKDRGGIAIVQSLEEAPDTSMPSSALQHVDVDHTLRVAEMPRQLQILTRERSPHQEAAPMADRRLETEVAIAQGDSPPRDQVRALGSQAFYTCPDCHGSMDRIEEGSIQRFRCHTGHAFSMNALSFEPPRQIERSLWATLALLEEHYELLRELKAGSSLNPAEAAEHAQRIDAMHSLMETVRALAMSPALRTHEEK